jgi:hypothetical protein
MIRYNSSRSPKAAAMVNETMMIDILCGRAMLRGSVLQPLNFV